MKQPRHFSKATVSPKHSGFTLVELMVVVAVIGLMAAIGTPVVLNLLPNYKLKAAARDLYSSLQQTRLLAIKTNNNVRLVLDNTVSPGFYFIDVDASGTLNLQNEYRIDLASYGYGVDFGFPPGLVNWNGKAVTNSVVFGGNPGPPPFCSYNSNGTSGSGSIYLSNAQNSIVYAITTVDSGAVKLRKYNGLLPFNQNNWID